MHKDFAEWYRIVAIEPNEEKLTKRWAAIEEWHGEMFENTEHLLDIVRVFLARPLDDQNSIDEFVAFMQRHDAAFPQRNELELRVLAGAAIVKCLSDLDTAEENPSAIIAGLAILVGSFQREIEPSPLQEIEELARHHFGNFEDQVRSRSHGLSSSISDEKTKKLLKQFSSAPPGDHSQLYNAILPVLQAALESAEKADSTIEAIQHDLRCVDEECDMLWWLEGGCSRDLNEAWSSISKDAVPVVAAKELADLTTMIPGPRHSKALLQKVASGVACNELVFGDAINSVPVDWLNEAIKPLSKVKAFDLTPVWFALTKRAETDDSAWQSYFEKMSGIPTTKRLNAYDLAQQTYTEALLLRAIRESEE